MEQIKVRQGGFLKPGSHTNNMSYKNLNRIIFIILISFSTINCNRKSEMVNQEGVFSYFKKLQNHNQEIVAIEGIYTLVHPFPDQKKRFPDEVIVKIIMVDEDGPFLEPYWHANSKRSNEEIRKYADKKVIVRGVFYQEQPLHPDQEGSEAIMGGSCIHPVEGISLVK